MKKLFLIDADYCPYAFGDRLDIEVIVSVDKWCSHLNEVLGEGTYLYFISGKDNFRYKIAKTKPYKANRNDREKPKYYDEIREYLKVNYDTIVVNGAEADDGISIFAERYKHLYEIWIISDDKDFGQIICKQYRHSKNQFLDTKHEIVKRQKITSDIDTGIISYVDYNDYYGDYMLYYQMLVGDTVDNIPGVPGIGKSNKIFKDEFVQGITIEEARNLVWREYQDTYQEKSVSVYLEQYMLLRLMRTNKNVGNGL